MFVQLDPVSCARSQLHCRSRGGSARSSVRVFWSGPRAATARALLSGNQFTRVRLEVVLEPRPTRTGAGAAGAAPDAALPNAGTLPSIARLGCG